MWLSQGEIAEQGGGGGGCPVIIPSHRGAVIVLIVNIIDHITIVCLKISFNPSQKYNMRRDKTKNVMDNFKGLSLGF